MRRGWICAAVGLALAAGGAGTAQDAGKTRNPFNVKDVPDPEGADVKAFAAQLKLPGGGADGNAPQWAAKATAGRPESLDGEWSSRWSGGAAGGDWIAGTATVKTVGDWVHILHKDATNTYLISAKRVGQTRLVGRYMNLGVNSDSTPWAGTIVDGERIDGGWTMGRWDLRRKLADKPAGR